MGSIPFDSVNVCVSGRVTSVTMHPPLNVVIGHIGSSLQYVTTEFFEL